MKVCTKCNVNKEYTFFHRNSASKDGYKTRCKLCRNKESKVLWEKDKTRIKEVRKLRREESLIYLKQWQEDNKEYMIAYRKEKYKSEGKIIRRKNKIWRDNNQGKILALNAARRASKLSATPKWLSKYHKTRIRDIYIVAKEFTSATDETFHVDHIIPLNGKNVCGLHVPWNLQILPAYDNLSKGNKYE